ncbi:unnamed protein product, partial [Ranitomeya imitator]
MVLCPPMSGSEKRILRNPPWEDTTRGHSTTSLASRNTSILIPWLAGGMYCVLATYASIAAIVLFFKLKPKKQAANAPAKGSICRSLGMNVIVLREGMQTGPSRSFTKLLCGSLVLNGPRSSDRPSQMRLNPCWDKGVPDA